jgi:hypothetical protein
MPILLVLGGILDDFLSFLPLLLDKFSIFARKKKMLYGHKST